jgi:mRNA interferase MazF
MPSNPKRGEIWLVNLDPTVGAEIQKTRPAIILSSDYIGKLPLKLVVPITDWKPAFASDLWHIRLDPTEQNGLTKPSAADALQSRSLDIRRFIRKLGTIPDSDMQEITKAIVAIIEYQEVPDRA